MQPIIPDQPPVHWSHPTISTFLLSTPFWAGAIQGFSDAMYVISVTSGAIIGCWTLYRMWKNRKK